jgi:hypothetical protein
MPSWRYGPEAEQARSRKLIMLEQGVEIAPDIGGFGGC